MSDRTSRGDPALDGERLRREAVSARNPLERWLRVAVLLAVLALVSVISWQAVTSG